MNEKILSRLCERMKAPGICECVDNDVKFEPWLRLELCEILKESWKVVKQEQKIPGMNGQVVDIVFGDDSSEHVCEIKVIYTNKHALEDICDIKHEIEAKLQPAPYERKWVLFVVILKEEGRAKKTEDSVWVTAEQIQAFFDIQNAMADRQLSRQDFVFLSEQKGVIFAGQLKNSKHAT